LAPLLLSFVRKLKLAKDMTELFGECPDILKKYGVDPKWSEFEMFVFDYSDMCK